MAGRPFTGDAAALLPCCGLPGADEPTTTGGGFDPCALSGVEEGFFAAPAAEAYDVAEEALGFCAGFWSCVLAGDVIRLADLRQSWERRVDEKGMM